MEENKDVEAEVVPSEEVSEGASKQRRTRSKAAPEPKVIKYRTLAEVCYAGKRVRSGELVDDIPEQAAKWLLENDYIKEED